MQIVSTCPPAAQSRPQERGAALITVLLITMLLLAAGGMLISVTSRSATNAVDATAETQAYYAAEAGLQGVLAVLRGNVKPTPLSSDASENKITFRRAITPATSYAPGSTRPLSRWLTYDTTYPDRVVLSNGYTPMSGMAYTVAEVTDPDLSDVVTFSVAGAFTSNTGSCPTSNPCFNYSSGGDKFILTYTPRAPAPVSTSGLEAAATLGSIELTYGSGSPSVTDIPLDLTINQTGPWGMTAKISCKVTVSASKSGSTVTSSLKVTYPQLTYSLAGVGYKVSSLAPTSTTGSMPLNVMVIAPEPQRLLVRVKGFGPRNASKHMQMLVSRLGFNYNPKGAITLRSDQDMTTKMTFAAGNSQPFTYSGDDYSKGQALPAFSVTHDNDYNHIMSLSSANSQMFGNPPVKKVAVSDLTDFLQTAEGAARALNTLRQLARNQRWPSTCTGALAGCDRYFGPGEVPADLGASQPNGLLTFVDGDLSLPPSTNGAGLLVVTGTLTVNGSANFNGVILVIGQGKFIRDGGGNGTSLGALAVAKIEDGKFVAPYFESKGSGNSGYNYDSEWVRKALMTAGPGVLGVSEY